MINYFAHSEKSHKDPPLFSLKKVDSFGIATLTCNKKINQTWEWNQTLLEYGMSLSVKPGIGQLSSLDFSWSYVKFNYDNQQLLLKLNFTEPLDVSAGLTYDYLEVHTNASILNGLFYDVYGVKFAEDQVIETYLPHLMSNDQASAFLAASILPSKAVLSTVMASSFALNLFFAGSMSFLWGMMYALQLIVHLPLVNVYFPANAKLFFEVITKIATFKLLDVDQILGLLDHGHLKDADPLFAENGYKSTSKVHNMGLYLVALAATLLIILALVLAHRWLRQRSFGVKLIYLVKKYFYWRIPIRYVLSTYLGFAIPTMMSYKIQTWGPWHATFNSLTNILMLIALGFFPLYASIILLRNFGRLEQPDFKAKFNSLYLNINPTTESNVLSIFVFCCRRMLFAILIVYLNQWPTFQIMVLLHLTTLTMSYIAYNKPFNLSLLNSLELINEVTILIAVYHLILFTNYVEKHETKYLVGWSLCAITVINILTNLVFLVVTQTRAIYLEYKRNPAFFAKCKSSLKKMFTCQKQKKSKEAKREKKKVEMFDVGSPDQLQEDSSHASQLVIPSVRSFEIAQKIMSRPHEQEMIDRFNETDKAQSTHGGKQDSDIEVLDLEMQSNLDSPKSSNSYHASKFQHKHFARNHQLVRDLQIVAQNNMND